MVFISPLVESEMMDFLLKEDEEGSSYFSELITECHDLQKCGVHPRIIYKDALFQPTPTRRKHFPLAFPRFGIFAKERIEYKIQRTVMTVEKFPKLLKRPVTLEITFEDEMFVARNEELCLMIIFYEPKELDNQFYLEMEAQIACYLHQSHSILSKRCIELQASLKEILTDHAQNKDYEYKYL